MKTKMDISTRRWLECLFRERRRKELQADYNTAVSTLQEMAIRRLYTPEVIAAQADMEILRRYKAATPIKQACIEVWQPDGAPRRYEALYLTLPEPHLFQPDTGLHHWQRLYLQSDDPDHAMAQAIVVQVNTYRSGEPTQEETKAFAAAIRATSSWNKLIEQFPWIAEHPQALSPT